MADTDLIACLYPFEDGNRDVSDMIESKENKSRYFHARPSKPKTQRGRRDRAPTQEPEQQGGNHLDYCPRLELRFSRGPRTEHGFVFGRGPNSDVFLPSDKPGISCYHFALTFDEHNRPIVKDLGSLTGIEVTYDSKGEGKRCDFVWIVGGHRVLRDKSKIIISVLEDFKFQIVVSPHNINSQLYKYSVNRFRQGTANPENLLGQLVLRSRPQTERASGAQTPGTGPIILEKRLGEGSFGAVTHVWDVSTGAEYALKKPSQKAILQKRVNVSAWKKEASIMSQISHKHIVRLLDADFTSSLSPQLHLEYVPCGALEDYSDISADECKQILRQCLSALENLHGRNPPIVHRDIKPDNILVQHRDRDNDSIYVKFGDFGLSRESCAPTTICGTWQYLAPEVHAEQERRNHRTGKRSYTPAVDIWSLGVVIVDCAYDLPASHASHAGGSRWCEMIVKKLQRDLKRHPDDLNQFLLGNMVIMQPKQRGSAADCYDQVQRLFAPTDDRCQTPTPASYAQNSQQIVSQYRGTDKYGEDQETLLLQDARAPTRLSPSPSQDEDSVDSAETQIYVGSGGPLPAAQSFESSASQGTLHESCVNHVSHPLGGGSFIAAMLGQESSKSSSWATSDAETPRDQNVQNNDDSSELPKWYDSGETRKRPTQSPKSSSSNGRQMKRGHCDGEQITEGAWNLNDSTDLAVAGLLHAMRQG